MRGYDEKTGIFKKHKYKFDEKLAKSIFGQFDPIDVVDLGCGNGKYCNFWKNLGWNIQGYEGNKNVVDGGLVKYMDLSKEQKIEKKYDLVICLEVGEHIPKEYETVFIDNLDKFTKNTLLLSWAVIGQKGKGHVNCKDNDEVISIFEKMGFMYDEKTSMLLRKNATLTWFHNTIMVFNRG